MTWYQAVILGVVQGASEFLPISSSAHLVLVPWLLGWEIEPRLFFSFSVLVHWGTLAAVIISLREDLLRLGRAAIRGLARGRPFESREASLAWLVLLATLPGALAGILFADVVEQAFGRPALVAALLIGTAALLALGEQLRANRAAKAAGFRAQADLETPDALLIGLAQAMALLPGISRSGLTIACGLSRGLDRVDAARFSFLLAVPIMLGAGIVSLADLADDPGAAAALAPIAIGFLTAAVVGFAAIRWLLRYLSHASLRAFSIYCALIGAAGLLLSLVRG